MSACFRSSCAFQPIDSVLCRRLSIGNPNAMACDTGVRSFSVTLRDPIDRTGAKHCLRRSGGHAPVAGTYQRDPAPLSVGRLFRTGRGRGHHGQGGEDPQGRRLVLSVYALHRNEQPWDAPSEYRPERFLGSALPRGQYIPFGDGPRICIRAQYAETETKALMASVFRRVAFSQSDAPLPEPVLTFTMRASSPLVVNVKAVSGPD